MKILFVPSLGLDVTLLERLAASVDYPIDYKVILNNGPTGALENFRVSHPEWTVKEPPFGNMGVAGSWNWIAKMFPEEPILIMNEDAWFLSGYLEKICSAADHNAGAPIIHLNDSNAYYCFVSTPNGRKTFGEFDENFWPAYCLAPETPVLTDSLKWVSIGSLKPGDGLIGVEEHAPATKERKYVPTTVISSHVRIAPRLRITFEDGREVISSTDHKWLTKWPWPSGRTGIMWKWRPSEWLHPGARVYAPLRTWSTDTSFDAGWLSGILDGEGCVHSSSRAKGISFSQREGFVLEKAKIILGCMGIRYIARPCRDGVTTVEIATKRDSLETLGRLRPVRLFPKHRTLWDGMYVRSKNVPSSLVVINVEQIGDGEVVSIETTSHTFMANGIVSHNCEDCDMRVRHRLMGVTSYVYALQGLPPLPHGKPRSGGIDYNAMLQGCGLLNRQYWKMKWGSLNYEQAAYENPYRDRRLQPSEWVWQPEHRAKLVPLWDAFMDTNPKLYD